MVVARRSADVDRYAVAVVTSVLHGTCGVRRSP
jgi:hypothetical protein